MYGVNVESWWLRENGLTQQEPIFPFATSEDACAKARSTVLGGLHWHVVCRPIDLSAFSTEVLMKVLDDPIKCKEPKQAVKNQHVRDAIRNELVQRGVPHPSDYEYDFAVGDRVFHTELKAQGTVQNICADGTFEVLRDEPLHYVMRWTRAY